VRRGGPAHPVPVARPLSHSDDWLILSVLAPPAGEAILLVDALRRLGARAVRREGERLEASFEPGTDPTTVAREAEAAARAATSMGALEPRWRWLSPDEWARQWHAGQEPRRVSERIVVVPSGTDREGWAGAGLQGDDARLVIRLDPAAAFGTAEHPTTRGCLRLLETRVRDGDRILDVGTGSGVLAIAAARLGAHEVVALEADPMACEAARANSRANGVADRVVVRERRVRPGRRLGRFHGVLVNLQADLSLPLLPTLARSRRRHGWLVLSGITRGERATAVRAAADAGLEVDMEIVEEGWWTAALRGGRR
jgi:ribosomal protein L11 methyltransferase